VANVGIGDCTSVAHHATHIVTSDEFEITGGGRLIGTKRESIRDAKMLSSFQNGNAAGNRADECGVKTSKFTYRVVGSALVISKADVHFCGITLQARQVRPWERMALFIKKLEVLTNEGEGSASPFASVRAHRDSGK
jgi:hypothetical protein